MIKRSLTTAGFIASGRAWPHKLLSQLPGRGKDRDVLKADEVTSTKQQPEASSVDKDVEALSFAQVLPFLLAEDSAQGNTDDGFLRFESIRELFETLDLGDPVRLQIIHGSERHIVECTPEDTVADVVHHFMYSKPRGENPRQVKTVRRFTGETLKPAERIWDCCQMDEVLIFDDWALEDFIVMDGEPTPR